MGRRRRRGGVVERKATLRVEGLESRRLMAVSFMAYPLPSPQAQAFALTPGPDGNLWYGGQGSITQNGTTSLYGVIGEMNATTHQVTEFPIAAAGSKPQGLTFGTDGNLYFTDFSVGAIGVFNTTTHKITEYATPTSGSEPYGIAPAPDGTLWFTEFGTGKIGVFNPTTRAFTEYPLPAADLHPEGITAGPDGGFWFIQQSAVADATLARAGIGRIDYASKAVTQYDPQINAPISTGITLGKDGQLWFGQLTGAGGQVDSIDPITGAITATTLPNSAVALGGFATGSDGTIYFPSYIQPLRSPAIPYVGQIDPATRTPSFTSAPNTFTFFTGPLVAAPNGSLYGTGQASIYQLTPIAAGQAAITGTIVVNPDGGVGSATGPAVRQEVYLDLNNDGQFDPGDPTAMSDIYGNYTFAGLTPGNYTVRILPYAGDVTTSPAGGGQAVVATAGGLAAAAGPLGFLPTSAILPLSYNAAPFGAHNPDISTAEVNGLYNTILGHAPDAAGLATAVSYLKGGGSLQFLAQVLEHTLDYDTRVVSQDYENFAGRAGSSSEIASWVSLLQNGASEEQVAYLMLTSPGFNQLHPDDASFIQALYTGVLGRQADASEIAAWQPYLASAGRAAVVRQFVFGPVAMTRAVDGFGALFTGAFPDAATEQYAVNFLVSGRLTLAQVASAFASSPGFIQRANATVG